MVLINLKISPAHKQAATYAPIGWFSFPIVETGYWLTQPLQPTAVVAKVRSNRSFVPSGNSPGPTRTKTRELVLSVWPGVNRTTKAGLTEWIAAVRIFLRSVFVPELVSTKGPRRSCGFTLRELLIPVPRFPGSGELASLTASR